MQVAFGATPPDSTTSAEISNDLKGILAIKINLKIIPKCHVLYHCRLSHLYNINSLTNNFPKGLIVYYSFKRRSSDWHSSSVSCYWFNEYLWLVYTLTLQPLVTPTWSLYFQLLGTVSRNSKFYFRFFRFPNNPWSYNACQSQCWTKCNNLYSSI